ncbi:HAD-like domain-containing protein [Fimicolochytrium jonesii]|uniref:HAD-like domain-containing protein n=1 Tax=Fimicolochytrium jonesii TaxID=1396493 RepID=UPI0022FE82DB|nr:HAD-like domain-containing protein [Fimicolochytrium jonesii]KAI8826594.1 HAD-like domain-containing protein [Fimicolochytrium jonesii]
MAATSLDGKKGKISTFIDSIDTFLFDCDGVIWSGSHVIDHVREVLKTLRQKGKRLLFVTNNSTKSRQAYAKKFASLGIDASAEEIFGSSYAAAYYVANFLKFPKDKKVYVVGMAGVQEELASEGVASVGGESDIENLGSMDEMGTIQPDPSIGAVLLGFDLNINYKKLAKAFTYLHSNPDCHFLATNSDSTFPAGKSIYPGTGALLAALTTPLGRQPTVLGKPHQTMLDVIVAKYHLDKEKTCMIGDRLDTDIEFGINGGLKTLLVMTGVTTPEGLAASKVQPDYCISSLGHLEA